MIFNIKKTRKIFMGQSSNEA